MAEAGGVRRALAAGARGLLFTALLASPLLGPLLLPATATPRTLAFVWTEGRWLVLLGALAAGAVVALARAGRRPPALWPPLEAALARVAPGKLALVLTGLAFVAYLNLLPGHRRYGPVAGDEPKYLRMSVSLCRDLDADMSVGAEDAPLGALRIEGARRLVRATAGAAASLARGESPPPDHRWIAGELQDWTVRGWRGGLWYMQPLGLPLLLAPTACFDERIGDTFSPGPLAFATLGLLWAFGLAQSARLAAEVSGSALAGLVAGTATALSAPLLVTAWHVYPEVAAAAALPWLLRHVRAEGPPLGRLRVLALGLVTGSLAWLHVKFLFVAFALIALLLLRLVRRPRALLLGAAGFVLPLLALLLFEYHVTGLLRPDGRYLRHGDDTYRGPAQFFSARPMAGAVDAVLGAPRGLFLMAPVLAGGTLALPLLWRRSRRDALGMLAVFLSLLLVAALYGGNAPGPPSRLMSPVACVPAAMLAVGLADRRRWLPFRWTVAALVLATLAIAAPMWSDWRRINNPWRGVAEAADFSSELLGFPHAAGSPARWALPPLILAAALALGARAVARAPMAPPEAAETLERDVVGLHLAWWASILAFAAGLAVVVSQTPAVFW